MGARNRRCWLCALTFCLALFLGCNEPTQPHRVAVHGAIQIDQAAPAAGWVTLTPEDKQKGSRVTAEVAAGEYRFDAANGPTPGSYQVLIGLTQDAAAAKARLLAGPAELQDPSGEAAARSFDAGFQLHEFRIDVPEAESFQQNFAIE